MAKAVITFKIMPKSPETNLDLIREKAKVIARNAGAIGEMQIKDEPIAFGLIAVLVLAMYTVEGSDFDAIAVKMSKINGVSSAEVSKMDLALG